MTPNSLCALLGHNLQATEPQESEGVYWYTPPAVCTECGHRFPGHKGVAPMSRPRDSHLKPWVSHA